MEWPLSVKDLKRGMLEAMFRKQYTCTLFIVSISYSQIKMLMYQDFWYLVLMAFEYSHVHRFRFQSLDMMGNLLFVAGNLGLKS